MIAALLSDILALRDLQVETCRTGAEVRERLGTSRASLILLDLSLPDVDGLVLLSWIRRTSDIPVIVCTARTSSTEAFLAAQLGASDFIVKPFDLDDFESRIDAVLNGLTTPAQTWAACETRLDARERVLCGSVGDAA